MRRLKLILSVLCAVVFIAGGFGVFMHLKTPVSNAITNITKTVDNVIEAVDGVVNGESKDSELTEEQKLELKLQTCHTWKTKEWDGFAPNRGNYVWSWKGYTFYSDGYEQYLYDCESDNWKPYTWGALFPSSGLYVWDDGVNCYYSHDDYHLVLNDKAGQWEPIEWRGIQKFNGLNVKKILGEYYVSSDDNDEEKTYTYKLSREARCWEKFCYGDGIRNCVEIDGVVYEFSGFYVKVYSDWQRCSFSEYKGNLFIDPMSIFGIGKEFYCSYYNEAMYKFNIRNRAFEPCDWGDVKVTGYDVWTVNGNWYFSQCTEQYVLSGEND